MQFKYWLTSGSRHPQTEEKMQIKRTRAVIGVVAKVVFPCGCNAVVAKGRAVTEAGVKRISNHHCSDWKRHKYELAEAERDLADRLKKYIGKKA
jgi:hypothetical protein